MPKWEYAELILYTAPPDAPDSGTSLHYHTAEGNRAVIVSKDVRLEDEAAAVAHWDSFSKAVERLGREGWELAGACPWQPPGGTPGILHWFKREIP